MHIRHISTWIVGLFAVAGFLSPLQAQVCTVRGTVFQVDGQTPAPNVEISVTRAEKTGYLYVNTTRSTKTNVLGKFSFTVPRTVGTDTAWIHLKTKIGELETGQILYVPDADSAVLGTWTSPTKPYFVPVIIASGPGADSTTLNGYARIVKIENDLGQFTSSTSDSLQQANATAYVALNVANGKSNADSVHTALVILHNMVAGKANADSIHSQLVFVYNMLAGKPNADSVHTAIAAMLKMSDTTALHAQRFALINDSLLSISLRATTTKNDLTAHIGTADAHLPSQTGNSGKFLQSNGTVTSWQTAITAESDPTVALRIRDSLALYNLGIMRGDSAALTKVLDMIYPRSGGGAGLTRWDESDTSATQASRVWKPKAFAANVNAVIRPLGTGAFILGPAPDGTATGGNARGEGAVDFTIGRVAAANVASGKWAFAMGYNSKASAEGAVAFSGSEATALKAFAGGNASSAAGPYSFAYGESAAASGFASVAFGQSTVASNSGSLAVGGHTVASGISSAALGHGARAWHAHEIAQSMFTTAADRKRAKWQQSLMIASDTTLSAAPDTLMVSWSEIGGNATDGSKFMNIDSGSVWTFSALVSARSEIGDAGGYEIVGVIQRVGNTTSLVGTPAVTTLGETAGATAWDVAAVADDTNEALQIIVTGAADTRIRWHAALRLSMVGY